MILLQSVAYVLQSSKILRKKQARVTILKITTLLIKAIQNKD